jgi:hypothetical protein
LQVAKSALHEALAPPLLPAQVQVIVVSLLEVALAVPVVQAPATDEHAPLTTASETLQLAVAPPLLPAQVQVVVVPSLEVALAVPAVQTPAAAPHAPSIEPGFIAPPEKQLTDGPLEFISHSFDGKGASAANAL